VGAEYWNTNSMKRKRTQEGHQGGSGEEPTSPIYFGWPSKRNPSHTIRQRPNSVLQVLLEPMHSTALTFHMLKQRTQSFELSVTTTPRGRASIDLILMCGRMEMSIQRAESPKIAMTKATFVCVTVPTARRGPGLSRNVGRRRSSASYEAGRVSDDVAPVHLYGKAVDAITVDSR